MDTRNPTPIQFVRFSVLATALAILAFWVWLMWAGANPEEPVFSQIGVFGAGLLFTVLFGWVIWGPILLFALFPGSVVFRIVRNAVSYLPFGRYGPNLTAAAATSVVAWLLGVLLIAASDPLDGLLNLSFLLNFGIPAALVAALIALPTIE